VRPSAQPLTFAHDPRRLYGAYLPAALLYPLACLGLTANYAAVRELLYPRLFELAPSQTGDEDEAVGWAALPDDALCHVLSFVIRDEGGLLFRSADSLAIRLVCRSWRRVHDTKALLFLKPNMLHAECLITRFPLLQSLDLSRCKYADELSVRSLLARLKALHSLTLKDAGCGPRLAATLAECVAATRRLRSLNLSCNGVNARGAASLAALLCSAGCSLEALNVRENLIPSSGGVALAEALRHNTSLLSLDLSVNSGLGHPAAVAFGSALLRNSTLAVLNLGGCSLGDDGAVALAQSLSAFRGLRSLVLYSNDITDSGAMELAAAAAAAQSSFESLELRGNPRIRLLGCSRLFEAAQANGSLRDIHLDAPSSHLGRVRTAEEAQEAQAVCAVLAELQALLDSRK